MIAVNLNKKVLDPDAEGIHEIELVGQIKNENGINPDGTQSMFILTILWETKKTRWKVFQGRVTVLYKISNYKVVRVKPSNT